MTSSRLDRMDPSSESATMSRSPWRSAATDNTNSVTLPKVALLQRCVVEEREGGRQAGRQAGGGGGVSCW